VEQENTAETIKRLQGCISDLISVLALPALWTGNEPSQIINTLLDGLVGMLRLDFAYARIGNGPPIEVVSLAQHQTALIPPEEIGRALNPWLIDQPPVSRAAIRNPLAAGKVNIAPLRLGFRDEIGVLVAASKRDDFPTTTEGLLLRVAANQAAIALQETRLLSEQKRTAEQLEEKVAERSRQLMAVNFELLGEITERDRAEEEQRKLAALVENSTDFIGVSSLDGRALFLNAAGQRMVGREGRVVTQTTILDFVIEQDRKRFEQEVLPAVFRAGRWEGEIQLKHFKTGAAIPMLHNLFFIKEQGTDRRIALATIGRDITAQKQADEALRASEERFRRYFELGLIGMAITSPTKGCLEVNDQLCHILGYERSELLQKSWPELTHPDDLAEDLANFDRVMAGEIEGYSMDKRWLRKDGQVIDTIMASRCVRRADGPVDYFLGLVQDITERKQAEEQARKAHKQIDLILNSITDQFFGLSKDWRFTYLSKQAAKQMQLLGKDPAKLIGKLLWDEFEEVPNEESLRRVMNERVVVTDELFYARLGEWVENHMYPSYDGGLVIFQKYVTQRKRAEKTLLESERKFSIMFDRAAFAIALNRLSDRLFVDVNEAWSKIFGFTREEVVGRTSMELGINRDLGERELLYSELSHRSSIRNREITFSTKSGAACLVSCNMDVISFGGNRYLLSTMHDITEQKRAETERERAEAYLREGQRLSHTASWAWNVVTGDLFWSPEHYRIFGLDPEKFNLNIEAAREFIHPEDFPHAQAAFSQATEDEKEFDCHFRIVRPDGTVRFVHSQAHPVFDDSGQLTEYVGTIIDTTERKLSEEALRQAHAELARVSRVLTVGELTSSIAHELNQPLGAIVTNGNASVRLLSRDTPDLEGTREAIDCMVSDAMRASDVIRGIRALVKKTTPQKMLLDINEIIREVILLSASELAKNQVSLRPELGLDLQPVIGDRVQLQQVLLNLILNGNEAISKSTWLPREVVVTSSTSGLAEVTVSVSDTGIGLGAKNHERVFDSFFTSKEGGLGLGLSISRTIIEAHDGKLWCTQNNGKGATFQFTLPSSPEGQ
jgi:PAS domain S-box-containing protein